nr:sigma factor-like helix-turn-helix DNA-binding protein [Ihubacter massiliensis]
MQDMLRRYYENGQTMEQIGEATGYTKGRVSQKLKEFFE